MNTLFDLTGKVALVTGGTRGIGLSIAKGLKEAGAKVYIHGSKMENTAKVAKENGLFYVYADLKDKTQRDCMLESFKEQEDKLDILVNNAGIESAVGILNSEESVLEDVYKVNAQSPYFIIKELIPLMKNANGASVINVTSIHETVPVREQSYYCMSKAALAMFTKVAALEFAKYGIRFNNIAPGAIETDMNRDLIHTMEFDKWIPLGRVGNTNELVGPTIFLASVASSYVTATTVTVDGGYEQNLLRY